MSQPDAGHVWKSQRSGGDPAEAGSYETVTYCEKCGIEYPGEEFMNLIPDCEAVIYATENDE